MLNTCDSVTIHIVVDAYVDMLSGNADNVIRRGLDYHFHPASKPVKADGGICLVIDVRKGEKQKRILIDGGYTADVALHNMNLMGIEPNSIDVAVLSHGHPDHFGGLAGILEAVGHSLPLYVHPDAFIPRSIIRPTGFSMDYINRELNAGNLERAGAKLVMIKTPMQLAPGFLLTGQIERTVDFESESPAGRKRYVCGALEPDNICDDMGFVCNVEGKGLVIASMCGHSGIVSTVRYCQKLTDETTVYAVIGGFHLGHPGVPEKTIMSTMEALKALGVKFLAPFHCSGIASRIAAEKVVPESFVSVGAATSIMI